MTVRANKGFTLAEVLLTLAIIGVVAAMTIPALLGNTNQMELKTGVKKAVSSLNQALIMSVAQDSTDATSLAADSSDALASLFRGKLNVVANGTTQNIFYTADGMKFTFTKVAGSVCGSEGGSEIAFTPGTTPCSVLVDVNGDKGPNAFATGNAPTGATPYTIKDQYYLVIKGRSVVPANNSDSSVAAYVMQN